MCFKSHYFIYLFFNIKSLDYDYLQRLIGVHDDGDEEGEHAVDEKRDEYVEVDAGEVPNHIVV